MLLKQAGSGEYGIFRKSTIVTFGAGRVNVVLSFVKKKKDICGAINDNVSGGSRISPRRGRQLPRGGLQHIIWPNFPKNCMKLKEFGPPGGGGGARPKFYYVDPPLNVS